MEVDFTLSQNEVCFSKEYEITAIFPTNTAYIYNWTVYGLGSEFGWDKRNPGLFWPASGTGATTITLTVTDPSTGCTYSNTKALNINGCCEVESETIGQEGQLTEIDGEIGDDNVTYHVIGDLEVSTSAILKGTYIIDGEPTYSAGVPGGTITNSPRIIVRAGATLTLDACTLKAKCQSMWNGIYLDPEATLLLSGREGERNGLIRDSYNGITSPDQGAVTIVGSYFKLINNLKGISYDLLTENSYFQDMVFRSDYQGFFPPLDQDHNEGTYSSDGHWYSEFGLAYHTSSSAYGLQSTPLGMYLTNRCTFEQCLVGVYGQEENLNTQRSLYRRCKIAGILFDNDYVSHSHNGHLHIDRTNFWMDDVMPLTHQTNEYLNRTEISSLLDFGAGKIWGVYGTKDVRIEHVTSCTFSSTNPDISEAAGIHGTEQVRNVSKTTFERLGRGLVLNSEYYAVTPDVKECIFNNNAISIHVVDVTSSNNTQLYELACNIFKSDAVPSGYTRYGVKIEPAADATDIGFATAPAGNIWPVDPSINRSIYPIDPMTSIEYPDLNSSNWSPLLDFIAIQNDGINTSPFYYNFANEFIGTLQGSYPFTYSASTTFFASPLNTGTYTNTPVKICTNSDPDFIVPIY